MAVDASQKTGTVAASADWRRGLLQPGLQHMAIHKKHAGVTAYKIYPSARLSTKSAMSTVILVSFPACGLRLQGGAALL